MHPSHRFPVRFMRVLRGAAVRRQEDLPLRGRRSRRLSLEALEDRCLLSVAPSGLPPILADAVTNDPIVVSTLADESDGDYSSGHLSLREALYLASQQSGDDAISFDESLLPGTITLSLGQLEIDSNVEMRGPGRELLAVDAAGASRVFYVPSGVTASIAGLTVSGGFSDAGGGGIRNEAVLAIADAAVFDNAGSDVEGGEGGGGIFNSGQMTIANTLISGNVSEESEGDGIYTSGQLSITGSRIFANGGQQGSLSGGGIANSGELTVAETEISDNHSIEGGGIYNTGQATVTSTSIFDNSANEWGGGISNFGASATLTLANVTISGNSGNQGGGLCLVHDSTATVTNVTITNNAGGSPYGAPEGEGAGVWTVEGTTTLGNTIVAGNFLRGPDGDIPNDVRGAFDAASSYNLIGIIDGSTNLDTDSHTHFGTAVLPLDPLLGPLADNGGPTPTHALQPGSPAIDAGSNALAADAGLTYDQRGLDRVVDSDGNGTATVDMGAYELEYAPGANAAPTDLSLANTVVTFPENTDTSSRLRVADVTFSDDGVGTNLLAPAGDDAALFEIDPASGTGPFTATLYLKAGAVLDFETNPVLDVTVQLDDVTVGGTPDDAKSLAINVTDANDPPTTVADAAWTTENAPISVDVIANDGDPDAGDVVSLVPGSAAVLSATRDANGSAIALATATVGQDGDSITFDPGTDFDFLAAGETATVVIGYTATDDDSTPLTADGTLTVTVVRRPAVVDLRPAEPTILLLGSNGPDTFEFTVVGASYRVVFNGQAYSYPAAEVSRISFAGELGDDAVILNGGAGDDTVAIWPDHAELDAVVALDWTDVETVTADLKGGNGDTLAMYGTDTDNTVRETLHASWYHALFETAPGVGLHGYGYEKLEVHCGSGDDAAFLYDNTQDDFFYSDADGSTLSGPSSRGTFELKTVGFANTLAYASYGGHDTAEIHDTAGDDELLAYRNLVVVYDAANKSDPPYDYFRKAIDFEEVVSIADQGSGALGDFANFHDSSGDDALTVSPQNGRMDLNIQDGVPQRTVSALGYSYTYAIAANGGHDTADLTDSAGDDEAILRPDYAIVYGPPGTGPFDFILRAKGFEYTETHSTAGDDKAYFFDSAGQDFFNAHPDSAEMYDAGGSYHNKALLFEEVYSYSNKGGGDVADLYDSDACQDLLEAHLPVTDPAHWARLYSVPSSPTDYLYYIQGFEEAHATCHNANGDDTSGIDGDAADWFSTTEL